MSSLVEFGRRQAVRLHSLTSRQTIGLGAMAVLCLGVTVASATGHTAVATSALALLLAAMLAGLVLLARRMRALHRSGQAAVRDVRIVVEQVQRRLVAAVEKERLAAGDRHLELLDAIARAERLTPAAADGLLREQSREIEALVQLFQAVTPRAPMPAGDSPRPTDLLGLVHTVRARRPKLVVALGATPATVWLGYALESAARLVVVEHDADHAERTRALLAAHRLGAVDVVHAPLAELTLDGRTVDWYDVDALDGLHDIGLLVVTGPVAAPGEALPPALHVLGRRLATGAAVVVEESARVAPRQIGFEGLTPERRLAGRYTAWSYAPATAVVS